MLKRAYQLAHLGVKSGDKVIIYKSSAFDTYLLAVSVSYLGAVPVMTSYHLPTTTMEVFIDRLEDLSFYLMMRQKASERNFKWNKIKTDSYSLFNGTTCFVCFSIILDKMKFLI